MYRTMHEPIRSGILQDGTPSSKPYFDDGAAMEVAWASPEGAAPDSDLPAAFADLTRTTWSAVDEIMVLE
jgi:hypothetical protein